MSSLWPSHGVLDDLCRRWRIAELAAFGSCVRGEQHAASDVDLVVRFELGEEWSSFDFARLVIELEAVFGRRVDLVEERTIVNPFIRRAVQKDRHVLYAA
jgi:predicted nucleotidyltransferase